MHPILNDDNAFKNLVDIIRPVTSSTFNCEEITVQHCKYSELNIKNRKNHETPFAFYWNPIKLDEVLKSITR